MRVGLLYVDSFHQLRSQRVSSLGLGYIAAYLQQEMPGLEVEIAITPQELLRFDPDLIGVSAYTETLPLAREYAAHLRRNKHIPLILGGAHLASNPEDLPPEFDFGVAGEGEDVFLQLVQLQLQNGLVPKNLRQIQGLTYREADGQLRNQGRCPSIQDMDKLAHPNRRLMFASMFRNFPGFQPVIHIHTARGCPYRCTFCSAPLVNPSWRFHSPAWVIAELEQIARDFPQYREITISDDLFTLKKSRLAELVSAIREAGMHKYFSFFCSSRSNTLSHDMCRLLRDMNMVMVSFGLEAASDRLIRELKGVGTHRHDYERVLEMCEHYGIFAHGNFIIGSQDETTADLQATWEFVRDQQDRLASIYFSHMTPFPGTQVWDEALAAQRFDPETLDYRVLNLEYAPGESVFLNTHYSEDFYAQAYQRFKETETWLDTRYYKEQSLIADLTQQERWSIPEQILEQIVVLGWQELTVVSDRETWIPGVEDDSRFHFLTRQELLAGAAVVGDGVLLYFSLDESRDPVALLQGLKGRELLSLNYHIGAYPLLSQLLLGTWQEAVYAASRRRNLSHFTLRSLQALMQTQHWRLETVVHERFRLPLNYEPLSRLLGADQVVDPDTFAYLTHWKPL